MPASCPKQIQMSEMVFDAFLLPTFFSFCFLSFDNLIVYIELELKLASLQVCNITKEKESGSLHAHQMLEALVPTFFGLIFNPALNFITFLSSCRDSNRPQRSHPY